MALLLISDALRPVYVVSNQVAATPPLDDCAVTRRVPSCAGWRPAQQAEVRMSTRWHMTRRAFTAGAAAASTPFWLTGRAPHAQQTTEIAHWSWLAASDGEVWAKMIDQ